jgi:hypothetical protein
MLLPRDVLFSISTYSNLSSSSGVKALLMMAVCVSLMTGIHAAFLV